MIAPLYANGLLGHSASLALAVSIGIAFGFFLERGGLGTATKLAAQFVDLGNITFKNSTTPTRVYACYPEGGEIAADDPFFWRLRSFGRSLPRKSSVRLIAACALLLAVAGGIYVGVHGWPNEKAEQTVATSSTATSIPISKRPSIAVLAFENRSRSP